MRGHYLYVSLFALFLLSACNKDKPPTVVAPLAKGIYITNEGNFMHGNGEVSFYDPVKMQITNQLFGSVNGFPLGDVVQSMYIKDSLGYIVVNNSQKIVVVKIPSFQYVKTFSFPNSSPRYFLAVNDSIAYITDIYEGEIHVINYLTGNLVKQITGVATWTEHMIPMDGFVVVEERNASSTPTSSGSIVTINTNNHSVVQQYNYAGSNIDGMAKDSLGRVWLAVEEDSLHNVPSSLVCLNTDMSINKAISFAYGRNPWNLCGIGGNLYFFDNDLYHFSITDTAVPTVPFSPANKRNFYGLNVDPFNGDVYASDALDYVQSSVIYRYDKNGNLMQSFTGGIISGNFVFNNE